MNWIIYALLGMFFIAIMSLILKKLTTQNIKVEVILLFLFGFATIFYLAQILITKTEIKLDSNLVIVLLILVALFSYLGNLFQVKSIALAPNPAYSIVIISLQTILVALGSYLFFNSSITLTNLFGLILGIVAIILLSL